MKHSAITIEGYDLLGENGQDGLRYAWKHQYGNTLIESAAFSRRNVAATDNICGYTTSVSSGCVLHAFKEQCLFCRTGSLLPFSGPLSYRDIAKQNIFMVLADMNCDDHIELHNQPREFAYMGQGEPGLSYPQVRLAIELTNRAMKELGQSVYRHIFSTSGVPEAIFALKNDIKNYYTQRVTLHFSLHATKIREHLMPIERRWSYKEALYAMDDFYALTGEKPCVGIMLFNHFHPNGKSFTYSNGLEEIGEILSELDPKKHRISFCTYNSSDDICSSEAYPSTNASNILWYAQECGFDAKLFSSFGREKQTACGTLGGKLPDKSASEKWLKLERQADDLIDSLI